MIEFSWLALSAIITVTAVFLYRKADLKKRWAIGIDINKKAKPEVCEGTGIAVLFGLVLVLGIYDFVSKSNGTLFALIALACVFAVLGFVDDTKQKFNSKPLSWAAKTLPAIIAALAFAFAFAPSMIWVIPTALFVAGLAGLQNTFAGLNGWQAGSGLIIAVATAFLLNGSWLFVPALILCGAILGFLFWNAYPARALEGDSGTLLIGAAIAGLLVLSGRKELLLLGFLFFVPHLIDFFALKLLTNRRDMTQSKFRPYKVLMDGRLGIPDYPDGKTRYDFAKLVIRVFGPMKEWKISAIIWTIVAINALFWLFVFGKI